MSEEVSLLPNPSDGAFVMQQHNALESVNELYLDFIFNGARRFEPILVAKFSDDAKGLGDCMRHKALFEAMCRFSNSGGDVEALQIRLESAVLPLLHEHGIKIGDPWYLLFTLQEVDEVNYTYSNADSDDCIVVSEGTYSEMVKLSELKDTILAGYDINETRGI